MALFAETFQRHMAAIGVITVRWSFVDEIMHEILESCLNLHKEAEVLRTRKSSGKSRLKHFKSAIEEAVLDVNDKRALVDAVNRLTELYEGRNFIVHGQYGIFFEADGDISVTWSDLKTKELKADSERQFNPVRVTVGHLMEHADDVYNATKKLVEFRVKITRRHFEAASDA